MIHHTKSWDNYLQVNNYYDNIIYHSSWRRLSRPKHPTVCLFHAMFLLYKYFKLLPLWEWQDTHIILNDIQTKYAACVYCQPKTITYSHYTSLLSIIYTCKYASQIGVFIPLFPLCLPVFQHILQSVHVYTITLYVYFICWPAPSTISVDIAV